MTKRTVNKAVQTIDMVATGDLTARRFHGACLACVASHTTSSKSASRL